MKSIPTAITWEISRKGIWHFLMGFLGGNLIPIVLFGILLRHGVDFRDPDLRMTQSVFLLVNVFVFSAVAFSAIGSPSRLFHLPVSSASLTIWHLIPAVALVSLEIFLSLTLQNSLFDLGFPVCSPILFSATAIAFFLATFWYTEKSEWMPVAVGLLTAALGTWFHCRFSRPDHFVNQLWIASIPGEICILLLAIPVSFVVGRTGIARGRCGERLRPWVILAWLISFLEAATEDTRRFRSAAEAQEWYEWRLKGWAMPVTVVFALMVGLTIWILFVRDPRLLVEGIVGGGASMFPIVSVIWAMMIGSVGPMDSNFEMRSFLASRPITNKSLARTILTMTAKSILLSWSIWVATLLFVIAILFATGTAPQPLLSNDLSWIILPATLLGCWTISSVLASFGLTGRTVLAAQIFSCVFGGYLVLACFSTAVLSENSQQWLWRGVAMCWSAAFLIGTGWSFAAAYRQRLIERPEMIVAACVWLLLTAISTAVWYRYPTTPVINCIVLVGLAALTVAPLATAPLALAMNRTR